MFLSFCVLDDFFRFSKKLGFGVFLVHPPMASVLLSASVERCFVSRMRDFLFLNNDSYRHNKALHVFTFNQPVFKLVYLSSKVEKK